MIPKKLFSPKCLHPDREVVFNDDLQRFFNYILDKKKIVTNNEVIISYSEYKIYYKEKKISMLHFSRSKEENAKEYYECLFGQIQNFFFMKDYKYIAKLFSIYTLYSLYYTQTYPTFYQINLTIEYLNGLNNFIKEIETLNKEISFEIFSMMKKLKKDNGISIGVISGLKTIILNKYGLPFEQKTNVYSDYCSILEYKEKINNPDTQKKQNKKNSDLTKYYNLKKNIINDIKSLDFNKEEYLKYINENLINKNVNNQQDYYNEKNSYFDLENIPQLTKEDLEPNNISNFDFLFNKLL